MFGTVLHFLLFVLIGVVLDLIVSTHYLCLSEGKKLGACITCWVYIVASFLMIKTIFNDETILLTIAFATGSAIGTFLAMVLKKAKSAQ